MKDPSEADLVRKLRWKCRIYFPRAEKLLGFPAGTKNRIPHRGYAAVGKDVGHVSNGNRPPALVSENVFSVLLAAFQVLFENLCGAFGMVT